MNRIPMLCRLKTFYDGKETVPTKAVPRNMDVTSSDIYRRFVDICPMNLASTIANAVITSEKPPASVWCRTRRYVPPPQRHVAEVGHEPEIVEHAA